MASEMRLEVAVTPAEQDAHSVLAKGITNRFEPVGSWLSLVWLVSGPALRDRV